MTGMVPLSQATRTESPLHPDAILQTAFLRAAWRRSQLYLAWKAHWRLTVAVSLCMAGQAMLTLMLPWPVQAIVDHVVTASPHGHNPLGKHDLPGFVVSAVKLCWEAYDYQFLLKTIAMLLAIYCGNALLLYMQNTLSTRLSHQIVLEVRKNLFSHLLALPHGFFERSRTGDLTSRISKDTADIQDLVEGALTVTVRSIPTVAGILIVSFSLDWIYALTLLVAIPCIVWMNIIFSRQTREAVRRQRQLEGALASNVQEAFHHHKAVATLSLENDMVEDFLKNGKESASEGVRAGRFQGALTALMDLFIGGTTLVVLFVGTMRILHGYLSVGQLMVFLSYLQSLFKPIRETSKFMGKLARSAAGLERIEELNRLNPLDMGASDLPHAVKAPPLRGHIELRDVSFEHRSGEPVLQHLNCIIVPGSRVAVVGSSGSGKSSLLHLLTRLHDPTQGQILFDGQDIRSMKLTSLRSQLGVVLQDAFIFNMTIRENIFIAKPGASSKDVIRAAKAAEIHRFVSRLPAGYETTLGEEGAGLSGGQKRRLAIARAILRDAPIALLDEPTAGLDAVSEEKVMRALKRLTRGRTTIIVTHQLSTVVDADCILVLSEGKIVERGTHKALLHHGKLYSELWRKQQAVTSCMGDDCPRRQAL